MIFAEPLYLLALIALLPWVFIYLRKGRVNSLRFSDTRLVTRLIAYKRPLFYVHLPFALRILAVALTIVALARPQTGYREEEVISRGIDIMLTLDISSSMSASDLKPSRLSAAKEVIAEFIAGRKNDRIGLVVFSAHGFTQCPLTLDYPALVNLLKGANIGMIEDGTAIGMALATATSRLKDSKAKSRIVILLTDGLNNRGAVDPETAAKMAKAVGVKVYTVGVGKEGVFYQTVSDPRFGERRVQVRTEIDEALLRGIAGLTGGKFFRAEDEEALAGIYAQIDKLEKTDIKVKIHARYTDWFMWLLAPAIALMAAELILPATRWRVLP
jgi:Ca-activated chloride channel family protein